MATFDSIQKIFYFLPSFIERIGSSFFIMAEEEIITGNKFKTARNEFRRTRKETEEDDHASGEISEEEETGTDSMARTARSAKENSEETKPKKKKKTSREKTSLFQPVKNFFKNARLHRVTGLILLLSSVYLTIAFTSFMFTWKTDHDKVMGNWIDLFFTNDEITVDNWLGKLGAVISHLFIHRGFGVASFVFVALAFLAGFRLLFKVSLIALKKFFARSVFILLWASVALGFIFHNDLFFLGGTFGWQGALWLNNTLGMTGTGFLLVFSFFGFMAVSFNYSFNWLQSKESEQTMDALDELEKTETLPNENIPMEVLTVQSSEQNPEEEFSVRENISEKETVQPEKSEKEKAITFDVVPEDEVEKEKSGCPGENVQFTVEQTEQEAQVEEESEEDLSSFGEYDPTLELSDYQRPPIDLLKDYGNVEADVNEQELVSNKDRIVNTLGNYGIEITKIKARVGPTVTLYEIVPAEGIRIAKIRNLGDDIALSLAALGIRIIAPMPGKGTVGIEVPNQNPEIVTMRSIIASEKFQNTNFDLPFGLGKTIANETFIADLTKMPHLLIAGATGQGKSVGLNAILTSLLYKKHPAQVKFVLIDPKRLELTLYNKIERHFLAKLPDSETAIITETTKVIHTLKSLCMEMDDRLNLMHDASVRDIKQYNTKFISRKLSPKKGHKYLPYIVVVVDEFGDLIVQAGKEIELPLTRLAQMARATGIHLIIATQRPSVNVVTGLIKANFPARIAFRVQAKIDSRTILDAGGADQLVGKGDMLFSMGSDLIRLQCPFVDTPEVEAITDFIGSQRAYPEAFKLPEYIDEDADITGDIDPSGRDEFFDEAARLIVTHQQGSASLIQRKLKLGYNRAGRIVDQLEAAGIIGPFKGSKAREVLIKDIVTLEQLLSKATGNDNHASNESPAV